MLRHNAGYTGVDYMEEVLSHPAISGWYGIDNAKDLNLQPLTNEWCNTCRVHFVHLQHYHEERFLRPVSQQVHPLREAHVQGECRSIKLTSLRDALEDFGHPNFGHLFHAQIEGDWVHKVCGLVIRYDHNELEDSV
jgi:hypothetical protein